MENVMNKGASGIPEKFGAVRCFSDPACTEEVRRLVRPFPTDSPVHSGHYCSKWKPLFIEPEQSDDKGS